MSQKFLAIFIIVFVVLVGCFSYSWISFNKPSNIPVEAYKEISFRVKVANLGLQNNSLVHGKQPTDVVEVRLPGKLYDSSKQFAPLNKQVANRNTPIDAAVSDFSAFKADDNNWILENFVTDEQDSVRSFLDDKQAHDQNRKIFEGRTERTITGEVTYNGYVIVFVRDTAQTHPVPVTFTETPRGWKRTNSLSKDETFDIVFSALYNGGEIMIVK